MLKFLKKIFVVAALLGCLGIVVVFFWMRDRYVVPIITYHNVALENGKYSLNNVTPKSFKWQMQFLERHRYNVISFDDYVAGVKNGVSFTRNTVVIHFDDGYEDNFTQAFPILKEHRFPATIFLVSDSIGTKRFLNWDQIKMMERDGIEFGAHTRHHAYLPDLNQQQALDEIAGSKRVIEKNLGHPIKYFVYPSGGFSDSVKDIVKSSGFLAAATTNRGRDPLNRDLFELNRIRVKNGENDLSFWAKLSGYYNVFRKSRCGEHCKGENYAVSLK